jgi:uncharacterized repeat protein (TIGR01451 family)
VYTISYTAQEVWELMRRIKILLTSLFFLLIFSFTIMADAHVISVTMNPPNPQFGDQVQITVNYCSQLYNDEYIAIAISSAATKQNADLSGVGQVFVVSVQGIDVATSQPAPSPGGVIGWLANANPNGGTSNCTECSANQGKLFTQVYNVHIPPASYFPGCNNTLLHLFVGMKDANLNSGDWAGRPACSCEPSPISWTIGTLPKGFNISSSTEGVLQTQNDLVLYSIDFSYWNGPITITDSIPGAGQLTLVSFGPSSIAGGAVTGPAIGSTTGSFIWTLPDRTGLPGMASGTVWMLYSNNQNPPIPGTHYSNSAQGVMAGTATQNSSATNTVGQAAISIQKSQNESNPNYGDNITYYLSYNVNGDALVGYQPFDDITAGTYGNDGTPPSGTAIPGWSFVPQANTNGSWIISDQCNTGDKIITGHATAGNSYPQILFNNIINPNNMCAGILETDVYIDPGGYEGADAMVIIRSDGQANRNEYSLGLSVDSFIGTNSSGHVGFQRCNAAEGCEWPLSNNCCIITSDKWYRVKIQIDPANQYHFSAKVWARGDPEPSVWGIDWTDPSPVAAEDSCTNGQTWKPGVEEEHGASGDVRDSYNNFIIYLPRISASTTVWDTVPNASDGSIMYVGQQGPHPYTGNASVVSWNLGTLSNESGTFTWWGRVNTCNQITNDSWINGAAPEIAQKSNLVTANPVCPQVIGITKTANVASAAVGDPITWTIAYCNDGPGDILNCSIWDTLPPQMTFGGIVGGGTKVGNVITWNIGTLAKGTCNQSVSWWGFAATCGAVANQAAIAGSGGINTASNMASVNVLCPTLTSTNTPTLTPYLGSPTFTNTIDINATPTYTATITPTFLVAASGLDLKVMATSAYICNNSNTMPFEFQIYNNGSAPVAVNTLAVRFWYTSSAGKTYTVSFYDQRTQPDNQTNINTLFAWTANSPPSCPQANQQITLTFPGSATIIPGGYLKIDGAVNFTDYTVFDPECDDYSVIGSTTLHDDSHFVLYSNGSIANETSGGYGLPPCTIPSPTPTPPAGSFTITPTATLTCICTFSSTPTMTPTYTVTGTATVTLTITRTPTFPAGSATNTMTATPTLTIVATAGTAGSRIISVILNPPNPGYGDLVQITVNLCSSVYSDPNLAIAVSTQNSPQTAGAGGQVFVVDTNGVDRRDIAFPSGSSALGMDEGMTGGPAPAGQCRDCGGADGWPQTYTYTVHMPSADYFSGVCNPTGLYVIVGMENFVLLAGDWSGLAAGCGGTKTYLSTAIPIVIPPSSNNITKRYEGSLTAAGDEVLYAVDYSYGGSGTFSITDPVSGGGDFTVVAYGPAGIPAGSVTGPAIGSTAGTYVWNFPSRGATAGMQSGTVWMLLKLNSYTASKVYTDTATTSQAGVAVHTSSASVASGAPAISISKTESAASLMMGQNITYVLSFDINGYALKNFQPFDNIAAGTYNNNTGAPAGWKFMPYNGDPGTWTIHDPCNAGGSYITASGNPTTYPGLLLDDGGTHTQDQFCTGMIVSDFYIEDSAYSGADAQVLVRSNYQTGTAGRSIGIAASIDLNPAALFISLCGGTTPAPFCGAIGPAGSFTNSPTVGLISSKKWYRMRVLVTPAGTGQEVKVRVWAKGDPEPVAWDIDYTIPSVGAGGSADWDCSGTGTTNDWRPGVNQQTGDGASVQDSYDNFTVYTPRMTSAGTLIYDTVPTGVTYVGNAGGCIIASGVVNCGIGTASLTSGSFTWWGTANTCNSTITNQGLLTYSLNAGQIASNWVSANVMCWSPTVTPTNVPIIGTPTFTRTFMNSATPSPTYTITNTATNTLTATPTFAAGTCVPASAQLCAAVDDIAEIYLNGVDMGQFGYVISGSPGSPKCIALDAAQLAALKDTGNEIAVSDLNTQGSEMWAQWTLDVTCSNGQHAYTSSANGAGINMFHTTGCPAGVPANDPSGHQWWDPLYTRQGTWNSPVVVTGFTYGKRIYDPATGSMMPPLGYSTTSPAADNDCQMLYFIQSFNLTTQPTPAPPNFTTVKSANQTTGITSPGYLTFTMVVCNTGGGTFGNPVQMVDTWNNANWQYSGPYSLPWSDTFGEIDLTQGNPFSWVFSNGMPMGACFTFISIMQEYNTESPTCMNWNNNAAVYYLSTQQAVSTIALHDLCPSPTVTPMPPVLTLLKTANKTTGIVQNDQITFNLHFCNNGGVMNAGAITIMDDWSSSADSWQFNGPYYTGNPATGIASYQYSGSSTNCSIVVNFQSPGWAGCVDIPVYIQMTQPPKSCTWHNNANTMTGGTYNVATVVSTINMSNICLSPTISATASPTYTITRTATLTPVLSPTNTQTSTPTFAAAACTPVSAILCAAVDDYADIWINSAYVDNFSYVPWDQTGVYPKCVALPPAVASALLPSGNMIAVRDLNTSCCEIWASWSLDITCASGAHSYVSSSNSPSDLYWDNNGCPASDPPVSGGHNWYDGLYNEAGSGLSWTAPVIVTGQKWGKLMSDPGTGNVLPALGYSATSNSGTNDCMQIFMRQPFNINTMPTPMPPVFTIVKTASQTTGIVGNQQITFSVHICNTGGGTNFNPVHIIDTWTTPDPWGFQGFIYGGNNTGWGINDPALGYISTSGNGPPSDIIFNDGFNGNTCFDLAYVLQEWNPATQCITWLNSASLQYLASPGIVATVSLKDLCPSPTVTPMPPVLSMVKSANQTTGITQGTQLTFNMHLCNTGGVIAADSLTIMDDWSSSADSWQFNGPYYTGNPATGISSVQYSGSSTNCSIVINFQSPGFTGCVDIPLYIQMTQPVKSCAWYNSATLGSYHGTLPTIVSTVSMSNACSSPTVTPTITPYAGTPSFTPTISATCACTPSLTRTTTATPTRSPTSTYSPTPTYTATPSFTLTSTHVPTLTITAAASATVTATITQSATRTMTMTTCCTPAFTATMTMTMTTPTAAATAPAFQVTAVVLFPNPYSPFSNMPLGLSVDITQNYQKVVFRLYTASFRLVRMLTLFTGQGQAGARVFYISQRQFSDLSSGMYYYQIAATSDTGRITRSRVELLVVLK